MSTAHPAQDLIRMTIDGHSVEVESGQTVLQAAKKAGLEIPTLCYLEKCGPLNSCQVCLVKINGRLVPSCGTRAEPGMKVESETDEVHEARRTALELLFSDHVGDCLSPCNRLCPLRMNIPVMIRQIQAGQLDQAIVTVRDALPMPAVLGRLCHHPCEQGCRRAGWDEAAGIRGMERFVADWNLGLAPGEPLERAPYLPPKNSPSGKSVVVVGAGPTGLAAAYYLLRQGHACTIADHNAVAGGTLRKADQKLLPESVLDAEIQDLERLGATFRLNAALGRDITIDGLLRGFDAVLLCMGELSREAGESYGLEMVPGGIKVDASTHQTSRASVFAAGRACKPMTQVIKAMAEGQAAAECIHAYLSGRLIRRHDKPFSSVMGRIEKSELDVFMEMANPDKATPCDTCAAFRKPQAIHEASRCLHCDCRSSGNCALQSWAQAYGADASRFKQHRKPFEQQRQPGGVIFEAGKCIACGICVRLTELAREPLGLTFIGRGFDVRVATPFNGSIDEGLQKVAEECVRYCPTGALAFAEGKERMSAAAVSHQSPA